MPAHLRAALTQTQLSIPVDGGRMVLGTWQGIYLFEHRREPPRARDRASPDRRMSDEPRVRPRLARASTRPTCALIEVEESTATVDDRGAGARRRAGADRQDAGGPRRRRRLFLLVTRGDARLDNAQDQGRVRRAPAHARGGGDAGADRPSGRRRLPVRAGDRAAGLSRRVAAGVRHWSIRRAARSTRRSRCRPSGCSTWSASAGSTYAAYPRKRAGLSSSAATSAIGHGVPAISASHDRRHRRRGLQPEAALPGQPEEALRIVDRTRRRVAVRREGPQARPAAVDPADLHRRPLLHAMRGKRDLIFVGLGVARVGRHLVHRRGEQPARSRARNRARRRPSWRTASRSRSSPSGRIEGDDRAPQRHAARCGATPGQLARRHRPRRRRH